MKLGAEPDDTLEGARVGIIGGGLGGIAMAVKLLKAGFDDFTIFEQSEGFGGTWWDNRYPGAEVDLPSEYYSYSFMPWPWSRTHAQQAELHRYLEAVVETYGLRERFRFSTRVARVEWRQDGRGYDFLGSERERLGSFTHVVSALGQLNNPQYPEWPGLERFTGSVFHTSRWPQDVDLRGKRVSVVGTGSTCSQVVPAVAEVAERVTVFQRQASWVLPKGDRDFEDDEIRRIHRSPMLRRWRRLRAFLHSERMRRAADPSSPRQAEQRALATSYIAETITDPTLRAALTPDHPFFCKRPVVSSNYLPALNRDNVTLVPRAVVDVDGDHVIDSAGVDTPTDVLVIATGFQASNLLGTLDLVGPSGVSLHEQWAGEPRGYLGIMTPGFPNFFMLYGPNTNGGSIIFVVERQAEWIVRELRRSRRRARAAEVSPELDASYATWVDRSNETRTWSSSDCTNYYRTPSGRVATQFPGSALAYWGQLKFLRASGAFSGWLAGLLARRASRFAARASRAPVDPVRVTVQR